MSAPTTHWRRRLRSSVQPAYLLLADLIADDARSGRLAAGDRLPTLRELARQLELNYTTVARGYAEARKRGLIDSTPGMGTFVRAGGGSARPRTGSGLEMTMNLPPEPADPALLARLRESASQAFARADMHALLRYQDFGGAPHDREVAAGWLRSFVPQARAQTTLVCPGIHSVLTALVSQLARPGDVICADALTYPGMKAIAAQLGVRLQALPGDAEGPLPEAFDDACRTQAPKALYCNPTLLNPTTVTMSIARRQALAAVALRHDVPVIEDDAYGMLPAQALPAIASFAPELSYYVSGFSKWFGAGLRCAYVHAPGTQQAQRLAGTLRATTVMASPVTSALTTLWIEDGTAAAMLRAVRQECSARQKLAHRYLGQYGLQAHPEGFHAWLPLATGWMPVEFASFLRTQNVGVVASAAFSTDGDPPDAVRICLGGPMSREECDLAVQLIAETLTHPQHPHSTHSTR
ncbi:MAG: PLP-dependent aminotransferase family protein [Lysobacteraceae bacterium]|nr:MAG: PLP-dependent aminotransferase family protein [Xanthomonadaceae bacterium]